MNELNADEKTESYFIILENITTMNTKKTDTFIYEEMKDKEDYQMAAQEAELDEFKDKAAASRAKKEAGWKNIMGGAQLGLSALSMTGMGGGVPN